MTALTADFISNALKNTVWDLGNQALYDICKKYPGHSADDVIIAKVWLIGRTYAAAIERRRAEGAEDDGDLFYENVVAPRMRESAIDTWFRSLATAPETDTRLTLGVHQKVTNLFRDISGLDKRSLASKYLHFHFPERFFIFDTRAQKSISKLTKTAGRRRLSEFGKSDHPYASFFLRCQSLNEDIGKKMKRSLSPRELDKVLLAWSMK